MTMPISPDYFIFRLLNYPDSNCFFKISYPSFLITKQIATNVILLELPQILMNPFQKGNKYFLFSLLRGKKFFQSIASDLLSNKSRTQHGRIKKEDKQGVSSFSETFTTTNVLLLVTSKSVYSKG